MHAPLTVAITDSCTKSIPSAGAFQGTPAMDYKAYYKSYALFKQFPKIEARLRKLEQLLKP